MKDVFVVEGSAVVNTVTRERIWGVEDALEDMARELNRAYRRGYRAARKDIRTALGVTE